MTILNCLTLFGTLYVTRWFKSSNCHASRVVHSFPLSRVSQLWHLFVTMENGDKLDIGMKNEKRNDCVSQLRYKYRILSVRTFINTFSELQHEREKCNSRHWQVVKMCLLDTFVKNTELKHSSWRLIQVLSSLEKFENSRVHELI